ncbi:phosphoribosylanthranilate isomerase [Peribacillus glennii]|uniref:N-(5'-phosphoribosyl)anthranilate isomerase n=1 Tax=Peribacillus glennii TaxID=2303991 RepID=A0A372LBY3_9BACI|nr:phosphoribosylanthranilate isomerase [Peribacillus glennii]RFU63420.1 phosphoribosylanthranilate isomerase [Peribacillus glennii]
MIVKICGITTHEAARAAVDAGADLLGFVFAKSKRRIEPELAAEIIAGIKGKAKTAGVFVNEHPDEINRIQSIAGLDYIQLHGDESTDYINGLRLPVIKAFGIGKQEDLNKLASYQADYFLLDSPKGKYQGGNGIAIDQQILDPDALPLNKVILAGGLTPENVSSAIKAVQPAGVDVSSGVETNGMKDLDKIYRFVNNAKLTVY